MGAMTPAAKRLFAEVEAEIVARVTRFGPDALRPVEVVRQFGGRGSDRATLFRWVDRIVAGGRPDQALTKVVKTAAAKRAKRSKDPAAAAAVEAVASLPAVVTIDDVASAGVIPVITLLNECIVVARQVIAHARAIDGGVRNSKLLLSASEHLRRNLETAAKITELMLRSDRIEKFHVAVIEELSLESPALAERAAMRLARLSNRWAAT
jgi:hypothetical protein